MGKNHPKAIQPNPKPREQRRPEDENGHNVVNAVANSGNYYEYPEQADVEMDFGDMQYLDDAEHNVPMDLDDEKVLAGDMDFSEDEYVHELEILGELQECNPLTYQQCLKFLFGIKLRSPIPELGYIEPATLINVEQSILPKLIVNEERDLADDEALCLRHLLSFFEGKIVPPTQIWDVTGLTIEEFGNENVLVGNGKFI